MRSFIIKIWNKLIELFKQGLSLRDVILSIVGAILIAFFPLYGLDTIILTSIALSFRLNLPLMIAVTYTLTPLKFIFLIPFIKFGAVIFGTEHTLLSSDAIKASFDISFLETIKALSFELICGVVGWAVFAFPIAIVAYYILKSNVFVKREVIIN